MSKTKVVVSGIGPISSIGTTTETYWNSLKHGIVGISDVPDHLLPPHSESRVASIVKNFSIEEYVQDNTILQLLKEHPARGVQFAVASAVLAVRDAQVNLDTLNKNRIGVFVGTIGNNDLIYQFAIGNHKPTPKTGFMCHSGSAASLVSSLFDIQGPVETLCSGCPAGMDAVGFATRMIQTGAIDAAIVVGSDTELTYVPYKAFLVARGLATKYNHCPEKSSKPFDKNRDGPVCGEGACGLFIESEAHAKFRQSARVYASIAGYSKMSTGSRTYSHDSPSLNPAASVNAIKNVLINADWKPDEVSAFCANGSASINYDKIEANAIHQVFGNIPVFSIKGMIGQHGAGCTVLQVAAGCLSLYHKQMLGTVNFEEHDPAFPKLNIVTQGFRNDSLDKLLCQSISFGGFHYSCIALQSYTSQQFSVRSKM